MDAGAAAAALERARWRRVLRLAALGLACSLPFHAAIAVWLAATHVHRPGRVEPAEVVLDIALLPSDQETPDAARSAMVDTDSPAVEASTSNEMDGGTESPLAAGPGEGTGLAEGGAEGFGATGAIGGGGGGGAGLGGGASSTTFFGVGGTGRRFAFVVDKSGSMAHRMDEAKKELRKSIAGLPDYASVYVVFFDSGEPYSFSTGWERVRSATLSRLDRWLAEVGPSGGTEPTRAFRRVFGLDVRPDVVFFLSDGEIPEESVSEIRRLNSTGRHVTVNSIAFGREAGAARLRQVAQEAGGEYRHVQPKGEGR